MDTSIETRTEKTEGEGWTVGQWVARHPRTARVFETHGIDYCCAGKRSLEAACAAKGLDPAGVRGELTAALGKAGDGSGPDWGKVPLTDLIDHIESTHHRFLRQEKPRLTALAEKVARVHGDRHPELTELAAAVERLFQELDPHLDREEKIDFPAIREWDRGGRAADGELLRRLGDLEHEHVEVGGILERIRNLASGFEPPPDACNSYLALFHGLESLESDLHAHIHKENNILHARILAGIALIPPHNESN